GPVGLQTTTGSIGPKKRVEPENPCNPVDPLLTVFYGSSAFLSPHSSTAVHLLLLPPPAAMASSLLVILSTNRAHLHLLLQLHRLCQMKHLRL
ncbi:hypothetical protein LINPERPRIM_LOCUS39408, partial [Linum perenne]